LLSRRRSRRRSRGEAEGEAEAKPRRSRRLSRRQSILAIRLQLSSTAELRCLHCPGVSRPAVLPLRATTIFSSWCDHVAPIIDIALRPPLVSLCKQWTVPVSETGTGLVSCETFDHLCGRESSLILPAQQAHLCRRRPRSSSPSIFSRTSSSPARSSP